MRPMTIGLQFLFFLLLNLLPAIPARADIEDCQVSSRSCEFYTCMENQLACGKKGYFRSFGQPYCKKYLENQSTFSSAAQNWLEDVRQCLQERLIETSLKYACPQIHKAAIQSHIGCYVDTGFCELRYRDQYQVAWHLKGALRSPLVWQEALQLNKASAKRNPDRPPINLEQIIPFPLEP